MLNPVCRAMGMHCPLGALLSEVIAVVGLLHYGDPECICCVIPERSDSCPLCVQCMGMYLQGCAVWDSGVTVWVFGVCLMLSCLITLLYHGSIARGRAGLLLYRTLGVVSMVSAGWRDIIRFVGYQPRGLRGRLTSPHYLIKLYAHFHCLLLC